MNIIKGLFLIFLLSFARLLSSVSHLPVFPLSAFPNAVPIVILKYHLLFCCVVDRFFWIPRPKRCRLLCVVVEVTSGRIPGDWGVTPHHISNEIWGRCRP